MFQKQQPSIWLNHSLNLLQCTFHIWDTAQYLNSTCPQDLECQGRIYQSDNGMIEAILFEGQCLSIAIDEIEC